MEKFERGLDPKEAMGIGYKAIFNSMEGCLLLTEKDLYQILNNIETISIHNIKRRSELLFSAFVIIVVMDDKFKIMKNRFSTDSGIYPISELPEIVFKLKKLYDEWFKLRKIKL
ncbi:MAG: hypothetical protein WC554_14505 [Clostridia bacterium]